LINKIDDLFFSNIYLSILIFSLSCGKDKRNIVYEKKNRNEICKK